MLLKKIVEGPSFSEYKAFQQVIIDKPGRRYSQWIGYGIILCLIPFLPWTQNIRTKGYVSSINPLYRPQQVNSMIAGRIIKWYVQDGVFVKAGDTLIKIAEIKDDYLDPALTLRTEEQLKAKKESKGFYWDKISTTNAQTKALKQSMMLKMEIFRNKLKQYSLVVQSDSMTMNSTAYQLIIAQAQLKRQNQLYKAGLKSLTEYEQSQNYYQDAQAKKINTENKFYNSKNELLNIRLESTSIFQEYTEKIAKISGERSIALSQLSVVEGEIAKLRNQLSNYQARKAFQYLLASQDGQISQCLKAGIGESVKVGESVLTIVPDQMTKAVEISVSPNDLQLIRKGRIARIEFDGFPAMVFGGWPKASFGLFTGRIAAIDNLIDRSGKFKVWVIPDATDKAWPLNLRFGTGCQIIILLNTVPLGYEWWRQVNGFPPDFYATGKKTENIPKTKKK